MTNKIITRAVLLVSLVSLFTDIASEMLYPIMPVYLKSIGFSVVIIGILEGLAEATAGLSKGYFGNLSDLSGKRTPFIRIGYALSALSKPLLAVFSFPWWIFIMRTFDRLGKGIRTSARDAILSDESTPENKGKVFGFHRSMDTLGAAIGPILALIYLAYFPGNYKQLFIIAVVPGIIAVTITFLVRDKQRIVKVERGSVFFLSYLQYWNVASSQYRKLVIGLLAFTLFNSSDAFLLLALKEKGLSDTSMISYYILYNLFYAAVSYPIGMLADKIGLKRVLITGLLLFSIVYGAIGFVTTQLFLVTVFLIYGLYAAATEGVSKALITNLADKKDTATAIGFYASFASIFSLMASAFGGLIWFLASSKTMFITSSVGVLLVVCYFIVVFGKMSMGLKSNLNL